MGLRQPATRRMTKRRAQNRLRFQGFATLLLVGLSFVAVIFVALPAVCSSRTAGDEAVAARRRLVVLLLSLGRSAARPIARLLRRPHDGAHGRGRGRRTAARLRAPAAASPLPIPALRRRAAGRRDAARVRGGLGLARPAMRARGSSLAATAVEQVIFLGAASCCGRRPSARACPAPSACS